LIVYFPPPMPPFPAFDRVMRLRDWLGAGQWIENRNVGINKQQKQKGEPNHDDGDHQGD
jgi:hypothetical protein